MIVHEGIRMEKVDKNFGVAYKTTGDEGVWKVIIGECVVIDCKHLVDFDFVVLDVLFDPFV